jgi:hypothetical protein
VTHAVSCRLLTAEAWVRSWAGPCEVCGCQIGSGAGFSPSTSVLPCQYHSTSAACLFSSQGCSYQKDKQTKPGNLPKSSALWEIGLHWVEKDFNVLFFKELNYSPGMGLDGHERSTN